MKKVPTASGDYLVSIITPTLTIVSNIFMRNGTYPLMFTGRVYNIKSIRTKIRQNKLIYASKIFNLLYTCLAEFLLLLLVRESLLLLARKSVNVRVFTLSLFPR